MLGGDTALLFDAVLACSVINDEIIKLKRESYPHLLPDAASVAVLKQKWRERLQGHLEPQHYYAILMDSRKHVRDCFVQKQPLLLGEAETRGNTAVIRAGLAFLLRTADRDVSDEEPAVGECAHVTARRKREASGKPVSRIHWRACQADDEAPRDRGQELPSVCCWRLSLGVLQAPDELRMLTELDAHQPASLRLCCASRLIAQ